MVHLLRWLGIALGSLVAAWLAVWLVAAPLFGPSVSSNALVWLVAIVLGALVFEDINRREGRGA